MVYVILAIVMFLLLILVHEWGHYIAAKRVGVRVNEFSIGMGPLLWSKQGKETLFSLRAIPIGGFCAMEGEDEESNDPRAFGNQAPWQKVIILVAGAFMNFVVGVVLCIIIAAMAGGSVQPVIDSLEPASLLAQTDLLQEGDRIVKIGGNRILTSNDISTFFSRNAVEENGIYYVDVEVVTAEGNRVVYRNLPFDIKAYDVNGKEENRIGINLTTGPATAGSVLKEGIMSSFNYVRVVWISLGDLISGNAGVKDLSGPIGIVDMMATTANEAQAQYGIISAIGVVLQIAALIAVNLAVMNLLTIPALDGGRILFVILGGIYHALTRKKLNEKIEGYINMVGMVLLLLLMVIVAFNDVIRMIGR